MSEKLLTVSEVADILKISEEEVKRLVDIGEIPAYKIGGVFLRFRKEQIDAIHNEIEEVEDVMPEHGRPKTDEHGHVPHPVTELEKEVRRREPVVKQYDYSFFEKARDFIYFNDFYIISVFIIALILFLIFRK